MKTFVGGTVGSDARIAKSGTFAYDGVAAGNTWTGYWAMMIDDKIYSKLRMAVPFGAAFFVFDNVG